MRAPKGNAIVEAAVAALELYDDSEGQRRVWMELLVLAQHHANRAASEPGSEDMFDQLNHVCSLIADTLDLDTKPQ